MKLAILAVLASTATAFVAPNTVASAGTQLSAESARREFFGAAAVAAAGLVAVPGMASANREYENLAYLGGSQQVDLNNANVRVYLKMPGLYPTIAGKLASNGPYSTVSDVYKINGLTGPEKDMLKKYESRFVAKTPSADFVVDRINNGLYR